jgi:hypothetical protein
VTSEELIARARVYSERAAKAVGASGNVYDITRNIAFIGYLQGYRDATPRTKFVSIEGRRRQS